MYQKTSAGSEISLPVDIRTLHQNSHDTLYDRITDRGYAETSLTGLYVGMFPRDSSIQAMAHIANGESAAARKILRYLLSYHVALDLPRTTHIIEQLRDEAYGNTYLTPTVPQSEMQAYCRKSEQAIFLLNAPDHAAAQPFVAGCEMVDCVWVHLDKSADDDTVRAEIRCDYRDPNTALAKAEYTFGANPSGWQRISFASPAKLRVGQTYYLFLQASEESDRVVWNGTTKGGAYHSMNYDLPVRCGWEQKPYALAFEVGACGEERVISTALARGNALVQIELTLRAEMESKITAKIQSEEGDCLGIMEAMTKIGEQVLTLCPKEPIKSEKGKKCRVELCIPKEVKLYATPKSGDTVMVGQGNALAYGLAIQWVFDTDRQRVYCLDGKTVVTQRVPSAGERITGAKLLLSSDKNAKGSVLVSLCKGKENDRLILDTKSLSMQTLSEEPTWQTVYFDLPLQATPSEGDYYLRVTSENQAQNAYWCGFSEGKTAVAGYEALRSECSLISNYTQADANFMLLHAFAMYVNQNENSAEDLAFIENAYPTICRFANYYFDTDGYYDPCLHLILNPSLEHSRLGRYWIAYDLITNVFASQALYELSEIAFKRNDTERALRWKTLSQELANAVHTHLVCEFDGKKIYAEFYDAEDNMKFYPGISWVNLAPIAAEWYAMDDEIMANTYAIYRKHGVTRMYGYDCLASEATLGTDEITHEMIGKCLAWELMYCSATGNTQRMEEILAIELATAARNGNTVYPECWRSEDFVTDPGNQEHCSWQFYAMCRAFPQLVPEK